MGDLEGAISLHREALTLLPLGNPNRFSSLSNLALTLYDRFNQSGRLEDLEEYFTLCNQAASGLTSSSSDRLHAAMQRKILSHQMRPFI